MTDSCLPTRREWTRTISISFNKKTKQIEFKNILQLIKANGSVLEKPALASSSLLSLLFNIKEWSFYEEHFHYDANNCFWQFGPFLVELFGTGHCSACLE